MASYRVFTVASGEVSDGAAIEDVSVASNTVTIQAVVVGQLGRGRNRGVLPVANAPKVPCPNRGRDGWGATKCDLCWGEYLPQEGKYIHPGTGEVLGRLMAAEIGQTKAGKPKLFAKAKADTDEKAIVVFKTKIGFRGGNRHTGDRAETKYLFTRSGREKVQAKGAGQLLESVDDNFLLYAEFGEQLKANLKEFYGGLDDGDFESILAFTPFPGEILCKGTIAQGDAGRMGSGDQLVALVPKGTVFRTSYSGRLYGAPAAHYYVYDGEKIITATWEERAAADLF